MAAVPRRDYSGGGRLSAAACPFRNQNGLREVLIPDARNDRPGDELLTRAATELAMPQSSAVRVFRLKMLVHCRRLFGGLRFFMIFAIESAIFCFPASNDT